MTNYVTGYWNDLLDQNASDLDRACLLAWIQNESEGFPQALGSCYEVGIFQIDMQDGPKFGGSTDTLHDSFCGGFCGKKRLRDLTDDEELLQVTTGLAMVRAYIADAQSNVAGVGATWSDADIMCLAKLQHALPALRYLVKHCPNATSWTDFRNWAAALDDTAVAGFGVMSAASATKYYNKKLPNSWEWAYANAEAVGYADGAGLVGGGGLTNLGYTVVALVIIFGALYFGGRHGIAV